jgi:transposase
MFGPLGLEGWCAVAKVPSYSLEFRRRAVGLLESSGKSVPVLARELGVSPQTLRNWRNQSEVDQGRVEGVSSDERDELRRLRRENKTLREEREILKKAAAFFAREGETR